MICRGYIVKKGDLHFLRNKKGTNKCFAVAKKDLCPGLREEHASPLSLLSGLWHWFMAF